MPKNPTYEELKQRVQELERADSKHKSTERKLKESEERLKILFEYAPDAYYLNDLKGVFIDGNVAAEKMIGYKREELIGKEFLKLKLLPLKQIPKATKNLTKNAFGRPSGPEDFTLIRKDGSRVETEIRTYPVKIKGKSFVLGIARDITLRKQAGKKLKKAHDDLEKRVEARTADLLITKQRLEVKIEEVQRNERALKKSDNRYRFLINTMNEGLVEVNKDWEITFINDRFVAMAGYSSEQLIGRRFHDLASQAYKEKAQKEHARRFQGKTGRYELELNRADGQTMSVLCSPNPLYDTKGNYLGGLGVITEITQLKKVEDRLRKSEEKFKFLAENMADIVWTLDMDLNATYVSPSIEKVLGFTPEERKRQKLEEMVTPDSLERIMALFLKELQSEEKQSSNPDRSEAIDIEYYHRNGSVVWMENFVKIQRNKKGKMVGVYGASRDITERKNVQEALIKEKKNLEEALAEIKKLSGLLPICASCKKIRDDKGYWNQIESYIRDHSDAEFSHSICPICAKKLYPDLDLYQD